MSLQEQLLSSYGLPDHMHLEGSASGGEQDWESQRHIMEMVVGKGNVLFWAISVVDVNWHTEVYEARSEYKPEQEAEILEFYAAWLQPANDILSRIQQLESRGYTVPGAEEYQNNCREARSLLVADADFFDGDVLSAMRDRAIDDHREGQTADFNVCGE